MKSLNELASNYRRTVLASKQKPDFTGSILKNRGGLSEKQRADEQRPFGESIREELEKEAEKYSTREISIDQLNDNPYQKLARSAQDEAMSEQSINELAQSIKENGFYGALLARPKKDAPDQYEIAYGHRRREAAKRSKLVTLPVKVLPLSDEKMARVMASENFSRENLTLLSEAQIVGYFSEQQNLSAKEISEIVGRHPSWVESRMAVYRAPADLKEMLAQKPESLTHLRILLQIEKAEVRAPLIKAVVEEKITREQLRKRVEQLLPKQEVPNKAPEPDANSLPQRDSELLNKLTTRISETFENSLPQRDSELSNNLTTVDEFAIMTKQLEKLTEYMEHLAKRKDLALPKAKKEALEKLLARFNAALSGFSQK
jgi:ParB/RepB/Spo0J family partition protein